MQPHGDEYDGVFEKAARAAHLYLDAHSGAAELAKVFLSELLGQASNRQVLQTDPRYHSIELATLLLARSQSLWISEPAAATEAASLAVVVADQLDATRYGASAVEEVRARAWSYLGNGRRILGDLRTAAMALRVAAEHVLILGGDPLLEAEILSLTASLRSSQGQPASALPLIGRARAIYREAGDRRLEGRCLMIAGMLLGNAGHYGKAVSVTRKSMSRLRLEDDPLLVAGAQHNVILNLVGGGRLREARRLLDEKRRMYVELGDWSLLLNLRWVDALLARQSGDLDAAERSFRLVQDGFLEAGLALDAAHAMQRIAEIYALRGSWARAKLLAAEVIPIFEEHGASVDAAAARRFFSQTSSP